MSGPTQILVLAMFILGGALLFLIGWEMTANPETYPYLGTTFGPILGWLLLIIAFIPTLIMAVFMFRWSKEGSTPSLQAEATPERLDIEAPVLGAEERAGSRTVAINKSTPDPQTGNKKDEDEEAGLDSSALPHLIGLSGGLPNRVEIPTGKIILGRAPECDLVLSSQLVSRKHAQVNWDGEVLTVIDLGSSNATLVNDKPIEKETTLSEGDVIQIVDYCLEVELPAGATSTMIRPS